jgi:hypothetical protein
MQVGTGGGGGGTLRRPRRSSAPVFLVQSRPPPTRGGDRSWLCHIIVQMPRTLRVFLSSTWEDLRPERRAVKSIVEQLAGTEFQGMELFGVRNDGAETASIEEVAASDIYIGIIGGRYGSGLVEKEYDAARAADLPCHLYIKDRAGARTFGETRASAAKLRRFIERVRSVHLVGDFRFRAELAMFVARDLHNSILRLIERRLRDAVANDRLADISWIAGRVVPGSPLASELRPPRPAGAELLDDLLARTPAARIGIVEGFGRNDVTRVDGFLDEYLGTDVSSVLFGGRSEMFRRLDEWVFAESAAMRLLLIAGEPGRGKSALLAHWARRLVARTDVALVFVPISIRFETNAPAVMLRLLASRLAHVLGEPAPPSSGITLDVMRRSVSELLQREAAGRRMVVVIDGLDESLDDTILRCLPADFGQSTRIVISARVTAGSSTAAAWLSRFGVKLREKAEAWTLPPLAASDTRDVVERTRGEAPPDLVERLHRAARGEPLLLKLYLEDLADPSLARAFLEGGEYRPPAGLKKYLDRWWEDQRKVWKASGVTERFIEWLFASLVCARGPLKREELAQLLHDVVPLWALDGAIHSARRFLIQGNHGLAISHPQFSRFLQDGLADSMRTDMKKRLLDWCDRVASDLGRGATPPSLASSYVIEHRASHVLPEPDGPHRYIRHLSPEWREACERSALGLWGLAADLGALSDRLVGMHRKQGGFNETLLPETVLSHLCQSSVTALSTQLPGRLLARLVATGLWSGAVARAQLAGAPASLESVRRFLTVAAVLPEDERAELHSEARRLARMADDSEKALAFADLFVAGVVKVQELVKQVQSVYFDPQNASSRVVRRLVEAGEIEAARTIAAGKHGAGWSADHALISWLLESDRVHEALEHARSASEKGERLEHEDLMFRLALAGDISSARLFCHEGLRQAHDRFLERIGRYLRGHSSHADDWDWWLDQAWIGNMLFSGDVVLVRFAGGELQSIPEAIRNAMARVLFLDENVENKFASLWFIDRAAQKRRLGQFIERRTGRKAVFPMVLADEFLHIVALEPADQQRLCRAILDAPVSRLDADYVDNVGRGMGALVRAGASDLVMTVLFESTSARRTRVLAEVVGILPADSRAAAVERVLASMRAKDDLPPDARSRVIDCVAPYLTEEQLSAALRSFHSIGDQDAKLLVHFAFLKFQKLAISWRPAMVRVRDVPRVLKRLGHHWADIVTPYDVLVDLARLAPDVRATIVAGLLELPLRAFLPRIADLDALTLTLPDREARERLRRRLWNIVSADARVLHAACAVAAAPLWTFRLQHRLRSCRECEQALATAGNLRDELRAKALEQSGVYEQWKLARSLRLILPHLSGREFAMVVERAADMLDWGYRDGLIDIAGVIANCAARLSARQRAMLVRAARRGGPRSRIALDLGLLVRCPRGQEPTAIADLAKRHPAEIGEFLAESQALRHVAADVRDRLLGVLARGFTIDAFDRILCAMEQTSVERHVPLLVSAFVETCAADDRSRRAILRSVLSRNGGARRTRLTSVAALRSAVNLPSTANLRPIQDAIARTLAVFP